MTERAICAIEAQQKKLDEYSAAYQVGDQLKDIVRTTAGAAELVVQDLELPEMSITACEKKIKAFADSHKKIGSVGLSGKKADEIIRSFYGIAKASEATAVQRAPVQTKSINLLDFMD